MNDYKKKYIQYGVPSDWAEKYSNKNIPLTTFRNTSIDNLVNAYELEEQEAKFVKSRVKRKPPGWDILYELFEKNNYTCCLCKGTKSDAFLYHHIDHYSDNQNNNIENLAVLCPNDHDLVHREGVHLTQKISKKNILQSKKDWEFEVEKQNDEQAKNRIKYFEKPEEEFDFLTHNQIEIGAQNEELNIELTEKTTLILKVSSKDQKQKYVVYLSIRTKLNQQKWIGFSNLETINNKFDSEHIFKVCKCENDTDRIVENIMQRIRESGLRIEGHPVKIDTIRFRNIDETDTEYKYIFNK